MVIHLSDESALLFKLSSALAAHSIINFWLESNYEFLSFFSISASLRFKRLFSSEDALICLDNFLLSLFRRLLTRSNSILICFRRELELLRETIAGSILATS